MKVNTEGTRRSLMIGMDALTHAIAATLGPKGGSVAVDLKPGGTVLACDGAAVARTMEPRDPDEKRGVELLGRAAIVTDDCVGDGTATAVVLAHAMVTAGWQRQADKADRASLVHGIEKATQAVVASLGSMKGKVETKVELTSVAVTAAGDPAIGKLIAGIIDMIGIDGVVVVEESPGRGFSVEYVEGMRIERGFLSLGSATDPKAVEASLKNPRILIHAGKISAAVSLVPLLDKLVKTGGHDLLVIADEIEGQALAALLDCRARRLLNWLAIQAPASGTVRKSILEDIAVLTGGAVIGAEPGGELPGIDVSLLGRAEKVVVTGDHSRIVGGGGKTQAVRGRIEAIRAEVECTGIDPAEKILLLDRLASLAGGKVVIHAGSAENKLRTEKAFAAAHAAVEGGIVPGGGVALFETISALDNLETGNEAEALGLALVRLALAAPLRAIVANDGGDGEAVIAAILDRRQHKPGLLGALRGPARPKHFGYDAISGQIVDMVTAGIVDPAPVVCNALENAASTAMEILAN